jgi:hypothetical protein
MSSKKVAAAAEQRLDSLEVNECGGEYYSFMANVILSWRIFFFHGAFEKDFENNP